MEKDFDYTVKRSGRRTYSIEVSSKGEVLVRAPKNAKDSEIETFAKEQYNFVMRSLRNLRLRREELLEQGFSLDPIDKGELKRITDSAKGEFEALVRKWEPVVFPESFGENQISFFDMGLIDVVKKTKKALHRGTRVTKITIRHPKGSWGSCNRKGELIFNCLLMYMPSEVKDYVVVHELCHLVHLNHSKAFWNEVHRVMPNYKVPKKWLKENGGLFLARL